MAKQLNLFLICTCKQNPTCGGFTCHHTFTWFNWSFERYAPYGGLGLVLDQLFSLSGTIPVAEEEAALFVKQSLKFLIVINHSGIGFAVGIGLPEDIALDVVKQDFNLISYTGHGNDLLGQRIPSCHFQSLIFDISWTDCKTDGNSLEFVLCKLPSGLLGIVVVVLVRDAQSFEFSTYLCSHLIDLSQLFVVLVDRNNSNLDRCKFRRQHQTMVVRVRHYKRSHQTG